MSQLYNAKFSSRVGIAHHHIYRSSKKQSMENTRLYDSANYLETKEDIAYYLEACFEEDAENLEFIAEAYF